MTATTTAARRLHRAVADLAALEQRATTLAAELRRARHEIRDARVRVVDALSAMPALPPTPADLDRLGLVVHDTPRLETREGVRLPTGNTSPAGTPKPRGRR